MKRLLLPVAYLPPVHYFRLMARAEDVLIEQHETYPKQTFRNRCEIYTANGKLPLSIPVNKVHGNHTQTSEVLLSEHEDWQALHWRAIRSAYANSPFFLFYQDELLPFFKTKYRRLVDFDLALMQKILELIGLQVPLKLTETYDPAPANRLDLRNVITPKKPFTLFRSKPYHQTFEEKYGFIPGLSIIDLLFNMGDETLDFLKG